MSLAMFIGWLLDMNATTPEVVKVLREQNFDLSGASFDGGTTSTLHWGITTPRDGARSLSLTTAMCVCMKAPTCR